MAKMKELEAENARLRKMYVEEKIKAEIGFAPVLPDTVSHLS